MRGSTGIYTYHGKQATLAEISQESGILADTIYSRMKRYGLSAEDAALKIARSIYGGSDPAHTCRFRRTENGNYLFESDLYCCQVWFPDENTARLEVWYKKAGTHSLTRDYAIKA